MPIMTRPLNHLRVNFLSGVSINRDLATLVLAVVLLPGWALSQAPSQPAPPPADTQSAKPAQTQEQKTPQALQPIPQKENPDIKPGSKADVEAIGNRKVGGGINFYSLEREIAMGKAYAQEVERSAKLVDDPLVTEYVNRVG